ncbi:hypothetical protein CCYA_CCYA15G3944 [Cyanidiococcus yangmingshanensis]|nr:hypothetical protein CCYA_CCYA15G3944 [Cyanidiococcus yangmingshanensis]
MLVHSSPGGGIEVQVEQKIVGCRPAAYHCLDFALIRRHDVDPETALPSLALSNDRVVYTAGLDGIEETLIGHKSCVNCLQWQRSDRRGSLRGTGLLVSGDAAGTVCIWNPPNLMFTIDLAECGLAAGFLEDSEAASVTCVSLPPACPSPYSEKAYFPIFCGTSAGRLYAIASPSEVTSAELAALPESIACARLDSNESWRGVADCKQYVIFVGNMIGSIEGFLFDGERFSLRRLTVIEGHTNSVRDLDLCFCSSYPMHLNQRMPPKRRMEQLMLASASQDATVRLWIIASRAQNESWAVADEADCFAVIDEHQAGVSTTRFMCQSPCVDGGLQLLTAAFDRIVKIWKLESEPEFKAEKVAEMAIVGEQGHFYGFFSATYGEWADGSRIVFASTYTGALFQWQQKVGDSLWQSAVPMFTGHNRAVTDLDWQCSGGSVLATVSRDMTCRLFIREDAKSIPKWTEAGRPQVHGHEIFASKFVERNGLKLATAAEEKAIRLFDAPRTFLDILGPTIYSSLLGTQNGGKDRAKGASRMALSLTNQPIYDSVVTTSRSHVQDAKQESKSGELGGEKDGRIPFRTEAMLQQDTLWPESEQLFAHSNNLHCLASHSLDSGSFILASASVAKSRREAAIQLWIVKDSAYEWGTLNGHELTVTDMRFNQFQEGCTDRMFLLSVSRDRSWIVWDLNMQRMMTRKKSAHSRMILACAWLDWKRGLVATGGRDKCVHLWGISNFPESSPEAQHELLRTWRFSGAVTAMDARVIGSTQNVLIVGLENGALHALLVDVEPPFEATEILLPSNAKHGRAVTCVRFQPGPEGVFASSSEDSSVLVAHLRCS